MTRTLREKHLAAVVGEDWHPNINGTFVRAVVCPIRDGSWRVAVWGGDDFGLELDFPTEEQAWALFDSMPDPLPQAWCSQRGLRLA